ncbi:MAG: hypothetical protein LBV13_05215 [Methanomassiliicoccaceae archaeon]|jgi:DNA-directed RNA polymerase subunit RPC12/RpoP|nr:hypothetical protein [Methanomassiliicoccaceae archaeon]
MVLVALKCPNCDGETYVEESMKSGFCAHCGSKIINKQNVSGTITIDKNSDILNSLKVAREALFDHNWTDAKRIVENIMLFDPDCQDAWYMKALINYRYKDVYNDIIDRMKSKQLKDYGVFSESDIKECWGELEIKISFSKKGLSGVKEALVTIDGKKTISIYKGDSTLIGANPGKHEISVKLFTGTVTGEAFNMSFVASKYHEFEIRDGGSWSFNVTKGSITQIC